MFTPDSVWEFKIADRVKFGPRAIEELEAEIQNAPGEKAVIVTDQGIKKAGILDYVLGLLKNVAVEVFDKVEPDPKLSIFEDCLAFAKEKGADIFIGLGGGSALDIAKVVSCIAMYGGAIEDYIAPPIGKGAPIKGPGYFNIAIPTTSGTGSEV